MRLRKCKCIGRQILSGAIPDQKEKTVYEHIIVEVGDGIELITLNRPQVRNVLNIDMVSELRDAFEYAAGADDVKVVIITGAGGCAFSAGQDIEEMSAGTPAEGRAMIANGHALMREIELLPKPVIAAIGGYCFGGGSELAMACDIRIASDNSVFAFPGPSLGVIPGYGGAVRLSRLIGVSRAEYYCMTEEWIDAQQAYEMGLVGKLTEPSELLDEAIRIAAGMTKKTLASLAALKRLIRDGMDMTLEDALAYERKIFDGLFSSQERVDRMAAFIEKDNRDPESR